MADRTRTMASWTVEAAQARTLELIRALVEHPDMRCLVDDPTTTMRALWIGDDVLAGLSMEIEDEFGIALVDEKDTWSSVANILDTVREHITRQEREAA